MTTDLVKTAVDCPLCGADDADKVRDDTLSVCRSCGMVYLNPRPDVSWYRTFHKTEYDATHRPNGSVAEKNRAFVVYDRIKSFGFGRVLDIGCGDGHLLRYILAHGNTARAFGIEPSIACGERLGDMLYATDVDSGWVDKGVYDTIILSHSLEHFLDPVAVLNKVAAALVPDGRVYISTPDIMHPGDMSSGWFQLGPAHVNYFSEATMIRACAKAGLRAVEVHTSCSELWGMFRKSGSPIVCKSPYKQQMEMFSMTTQELRKAKELGLITEAVKTIDLELARMKGGSDISPGLNVEFRFARNNYTNSGTLFAAGTLTASELQDLRSVLKSIEARTHLIKAVEAKKTKKKTAKPASKTKTKDKKPTGKT